MDNQEHIIICGGGIVGAASAYYLSLYENAPSITVVERTDVACSSSGKAGGFLGERFGDGSVTEQLHRVSYRLHRELAKTLELESYRTIPTLSCRLGTRPKSTPAPWFQNNVSTRQMDQVETTAQVTPKELTVKLIEAAKKRGVKVLVGSGVDSPIIEEKDGRNKITGVKLQNGTTLSCTKLLVTMGAWSVVASDWFNVPVPMEGIKSTSIVFSDISDIKEKPFALFCEGDDANGCHLEVYPRPNGEVYLCGIGGSDYIKASRLKKNGDSESADLILATPQRVDAACKSFFELITSVPPQKPQVTQGTY